METYEAIMTRRSVPKTAEARPPLDEISRLLDAAVMAPNHHLTEPWRFIVLVDDALKDLGEVLAAHAERTGGNVALMRDLPQRAPVIITVIEHPRIADSHVPEIEEHYAVGAAMQNILLAAHDAGLVAMIRTGAQARLPEVREHLSLKPGEFIAGFIYVGYPLKGFTKKVPRKTPARELTEWRGIDVQTSYATLTGSDNVESSAKTN